MNIQYINKIPSKMEIFEVMDSMQIEEENIFKETEDTITSVCAYHLDKIIGMGRVIKEKEMLYIQDIMVKPEYKDENIENGIIVNLVMQINSLKKYNPNIQRCLEFGETEQNFFNRFSFLNKEKQEIGA